MNREDNFLAALSISGLPCLRKQLEEDSRLVHLTFDGATALHLTVSWDLSDVARVLIEFGADVNARGEAKRTPLHQAALEHRVKMIELLLDAGADVNVQDDEGWTALHVAGWTLSSQAGAYRSLKVLLEHGADPNIPDVEGNYPLHVLRTGVRKAVLLLKNGSDIHAANHKGRTPLHEAATWSGCLCSVLLRHGANVNARDEWLGATPLHYAVSVSADTDECTQRLIKSGADPNAIDNKNRTPLHIASSYSCMSAARMLLDAGADVNATDNEGKTPLYRAKKGPHISADSGVPIKSRSYRMRNEQTVRLLEKVGGRV